jgi:hypothetical protein
MGVRMGDEILMPPAPILFLRGDLRKENIDEPRDCVFSSRFRLRLVGLFLSFFRAPGFTGLAFSVLEDGEVSGGPWYSRPSALACSCSITYLYISSSCDCAMALSRPTTVWSTDRSMPAARTVEVGDEAVKTECWDFVGLKGLVRVGLWGVGDGSEKFRGLVGIWSESF